MEGIKLSQRTELLTSSGNDYVHVVRNGRSYKQKSSIFNAINSANDVVGGVVYLGGMDYYVWASQHTVNSVVYNTFVSGTVTLDNGGAEDRFDIFAIQVNTLVNPATASVVVVQGDESVNPSLPNISPNNQVSLSFVLVNAGATDNESVDISLIYDENVGLIGGEWDNVDNTGGGNLNYAVSPYNGLLSYRLAATSLAVLSWETENEVLYSDDSNLVFAYKGELLETSSISIKLINGSGYYYKNITSENITNFGYTPFIGGWQMIQISLSEFEKTNPELNSFNTLEFEFNNTPIVDIDRVFIQSGLASPNEPTVTETLPETYNDTVLRLDNHELNEVYSLAPSTATTFTLGDSMVNGGYDRVSISTYGASEFPIIDDARAVLLDGSDFEVDSAYYMHVEKLQNRVEYWFEKIDSFTIITIPDSVTDDVNALWDDITEADATLTVGNGSYNISDIIAYQYPSAYFGTRQSIDFPTVKKYTTEFQIDSMGDSVGGATYGLIVRMFNTDINCYVNNGNKSIRLNSTDIPSSFVYGDTIKLEVVFNGGANYTANVYTNDVLIDSKVFTLTANEPLRSGFRSTANISISNIVQKIYL